MKQPKNNIFSILFGSTDKSNRIRHPDETNFTEQKSGIKYGIGSGQWEHHIDLDGSEKDTEIDDDETEKWTLVGAGSSIGRKEIEFLPISYNKDGFVRLYPVISMRDLDEAMFLPFVNESLAGKIKAIHVYANGYKLQEIDLSNIIIDRTEIDPSFPVDFDENELKDKWIRIRPKGESNFHLRFFEHTPKRLFTPSQVENSLEDRRS